MDLSGKYLKKKLNERWAKNRKDRAVSIFFVHLRKSACCSRFVVHRSFEDKIQGIVDKDNINNACFKFFLFLFFVLTYLFHQYTLPSTGKGLSVKAVDTFILGYIIPIDLKNGPYPYS